MGRPLKQARSIHPSNAHFDLNQVHGMTVSSCPGMGGFPCFFLFLCPFLDIRGVSKQGSFERDRLMYRHSRQAFGGRNAVVFLFSVLVGCSGESSGPSVSRGRPSDQIVVQETPTQISISTADGDTEVHVHKSPFRLEYTGSDGPQVSQAEKGMFFSSSGTRSYLEEVVNFTPRRDHVALSVTSPGNPRWRVSPR